MYSDTMRTIIHSVLGLALVTGLATSARADTTLDFSLGGTGGGTISYNGGGGSLTGVSIPIRLLAANATPLHAGAALAITQGTLSFTTGALSSYNALTNTLVFGGNGSVTLKGAISAIGLNTVGGVIPTLLTGSFLGATFDLALGRASLFLGNGPDTKNPTLVSYFFGSAKPTWNFTGTVLGSNVLAAFTKNGKFSTSASSVDVLNTAVVPEPASIFLFGTAVFGIALLMRRRISTLRQN